MKRNETFCIIGGVDSLSKSFFFDAKLKNKASIFINISNKKFIHKSFYNFKIFQLKKIIDTLNKFNIKNILFLGKINRPDLSEFKYDGEIDKHMPLILKSFKKGDGEILSSVIKIFKKYNFKVISPYVVSKKNFFFNEEDLLSKPDKIDTDDIKKGKSLLYDLSKYDNAQSIVVIKGHIIAIEAAEGTDLLLKRTMNIRKEMDQIQYKAGILTKLPKFNQSLLIDLPVLGVKTLKLIKKANLNGIAINSKLTLIHEKSKVMKFANKESISIYDIS